MDFDLEHARDVVAEAVEQGSLRGIAREIGMSPTGLKKLLAGTDPYGPTLRKLVPWYERRVLQTRPAPEAVIVASAVDLLLADFSDAEQVPLRTEIAGVLDRAYVGMEGAEEATRLVIGVRRPGARAPHAAPPQTTPTPQRESTAGIPGPRPRTPRRRLPVAQRLVAIGGAVRA